MTGQEIKITLSDQATFIQIVLLDDVIYLIHSYIFFRQLELTLGDESVLILIDGLDIYKIHT